MENLTDKYRLSIYTEVAELIKDKIYIVKSSLDDKIYIKKVLEIENYNIYRELEKLKIADVPKIYQVISLDNKLIVIEEYINGHSLKEILEKSGTLPVETVIKYTIELINILASLYSSKFVIIHRDIKPSNIMINNDGILKLIDFDISRIHDKDKSTDTDILGTYGYAAPEQFGFNQSDPRTDIYSLGVTMNMLLTGKLPMEELHKGQLSNVISKCIELDPKNRFQDIKELKGSLLKIQKKHGGKRKKNYKGKGNPQLPGFNSDILIFKILGSIWYGFLFLTLIGFFNEESLSKERISSIYVVVFFFILTLLYGNYKDIKNRLPLTKSKSIIVKVLGYMLYTFMLTMVLGIMMQ